PIGLIRELVANGGTDLRNLQVTSGQFANPWQCWRVRTPRQENAAVLQESAACAALGAADDFRGTDQQVARRAVLETKEVPRASPSDMLCRPSASAKRNKQIMEDTKKKKPRITRRTRIRNKKRRNNTRTIKSKGPALAFLFSFYPCSPCNPWFLSSPFQRRIGS